jgi:glycerol kinase
VAVVGDDGRVRATGSERVPVALQTAGVSASDIAAVGITNQRETTILWERATGRPVMPAIVWQCRRTTAACERLRVEGQESVIADKTGLILDPYFSATKIQWALEHDPQLLARAVRGEICAGTVDSWLIWRLSGGRAHLTDAGNASRTMLLDIERLEWDDDLLRLFGVPREMLPKVVSSSGIIAETVATDVLPGGIPIAAVAGDQQAALFGQGCFATGQAKNTYGTGCFLLLNAGAQRPHRIPGILTTIAWLFEGRPTYAYEGSVFVAGALVQWLRDELGIVADAPETERLALSVPDTGGVYIVPAFTGLGAPHWEPAARGTIVGLTRGTSKAHLVRAALEAIAYQVRDLVQAMTSGSGIALSELRADGGAAANDFLLQFQADVTQVAVKRAAALEATALGAAYLAGLGVGMWRNLDEVSGVLASRQTFRPAMDSTRREAGIGGWKRAVEVALTWAELERKACGPVV